jgi:drug/metabolite transporter (DMT)-like permease
LKAKELAMGKINWGRLLIGGLVAGVVMNILSYASWTLLVRTTLTEALQAVGRPLQESATMSVVMIVMGFLVGIIAIWLYAAIRPRFGPGPGTATMAGVAVGILLGVFPDIGWGMSLPVIPATVFSTDALATLVTVVIGTLIGAWFYKE